MVVLSNERLDGDAEDQSGPPKEENQYEPVGLKLIAQWQDASAVLQNPSSTSTLTIVSGFLFALQLRNGYRPLVLIRIIL